MNTRTPYEATRTCQPEQTPPGVTIGRVSAGDGDQMGFRLAFERGHDGGIRPASATVAVVGFE